MSGIEFATARPNDEKGHAQTVRKTRSYNTPKTRKTREAMLHTTKVKEKTRVKIKTKVKCKM